MPPNAIDNVLVIDCETYFDSAYSLSKMRQEAYIRDTRFKVHCWGFLLLKGNLGNLGKTGWGIDLDGWSLDWSRTAVVMHHAQFDAAVLDHVYGIRPAHIFCTLAMARQAWPTLRSHSLAALAQAIGETPKSVPYERFEGRPDLPPDLLAEVGIGAANDCRITAALFRLLRPLIPPQDLRLIDTTIRMFSEPMLRLDRPMLETYVVEERARKAALLATAGITADDVQSAAKFRAALEAAGQPCPMKPSPSNPQKTIPALAKTDQALLALRDSPQPLVAALAEARLGGKSSIGETRAQALLDSATRGSLPVYLNWWGAKTGRLSGGDGMNWQNVPARGPNAVLRAAVMAPRGHVLVTGDAAQIEARGLAWLAGEHWLLDAFREGRDPYAEQASQVFGRTITKADKTERQLGKVLVLGCGYGLGWRKFQAMCALGPLGGDPIVLGDEEAQRAVDTYRATNRAIVRYWSACGHALGALAGGGTLTLGILTIRDHNIFLPGGAYLDYYGLRHGYFMPHQPAPGEAPGWIQETGKGPVRYYPGKVAENITQALWSGLFIREAMDIVRGQGYRMVMQEHDSLTCCVPAHQAEVCRVLMRDALTTPPAWAPDIPLDCEIVVSERYGK